MINDRNIKIKRIKVKQSKGKSIGSVSHTPITMNYIIVFKYRTKTDAHNNSKPLIKRLNYLEYYISGKNR